MTGLRIREGLDEARLMKRVAEVGASVEAVRDAIRAWQSKTLATQANGRICLTDGGILIADALAGELMELVDS